MGTHAAHTPQGHPREDLLNLPEHPQMPMWTCNWLLNCVWKQTNKFAGPMAQGRVRVWGSALLPIIHPGRLLATKYTHQWWSWSHCCLFVFVFVFIVFCFCCRLFVLFCCVLCSSTWLFLLVVFLLFACLLFCLLLFVCCCFFLCFSLDLFLNSFWTPPNAF